MNRLWCLAVLVLALVVPLKGYTSCLPDAIDPGDRKNVTNAQGASFPLGVVLQPYTSAQLAHAIYEILITEVLGYNLQIDPNRPASSVDALYAVLGCRSWTNEKDRGCEARRITLHFMIESWQYGFPTQVLEMEKTFPGEMPIALPMGLEGTSDEFVTKAAMDAAQEATGFSLEYFKTYAALGQQVLNYFDNSSVVNISDLSPCSQGFFTDAGMIYNYWRLTGDDGGVVINGSNSRAFCPDGYLWKAPSCRGIGQECVLYITGGNGWSVEQTMQRSATYSLPLAIGVANSWTNYLLLQRKHRTAGWIALFKINV